MKKFSKFYFVSVFILTCFFGISGLMAQQFNLYGIDATGFPTIKANVYTLDPTGWPYNNLTLNNFELYENGASMKTSLFYECKKILSYQPVAVNLLLDNSNSMQDPAAGGGKKIDWVRAGAIAFMDSIHLDPPSVVSMIKFAGNVLANSDFQQKKDTLYSWITARLDGTGGSTTDFGKAFLNTKDILGSLPSLATTDKNLRRISILLSDGDPIPKVLWTQAVIDTIIARAKRDKIQIYAIFILTNMNSDVDFICQSTGGRSYTAYTKAEMMDAYRKIIGEVQSQNVCQLSWTAPMGCDSASRYRNVKAVFNYKNGIFVDSVLSTYTTPQSSIATLGTSAKQLKFGTQSSGTTEQPITLTAGTLADFSITGFTLSPDNGKYIIDWNGKTLPFTLTKGTNHTIKVKYIESPSTASHETMLELLGIPCPVEKISLIAPCGGTFTPSLDFGDVAILTSKDLIQTKVFINTTPVAITGNAQIAGVNAAEFDIVAGKGPFTLKPDSSLNVTVRFSPDATTGTKTAYIDFNTPSDCGVARTTLTGNGFKSDLPMPTIDWAERRKGTTNDSVYIVKNMGSVPIKVLSINLRNQTDLNFKILNSHSMPLTIAANDTININVRFIPQTEGMLENFIELDVENAGIKSGRLTGFGILPKISAPDVTFPPTKVMTNSAPVNLVITNPSTTADLTVKQISIRVITKDFKFDPSAVTTNFKVLKNNGTFNVPMIFTPQITGLRKDTIIIECDAIDGSGATPYNFKDSVILSGIGIGLDITPKVYAYGNILTCVTKDQPFTIDNTAGTTDLTITSATITGAQASAFTIVNTSMTTVAKGTKDAIIVRFTPTTVGANSAILQVRTSNGDENIDLTGSGQHVTVKTVVFGDPNRKILPGTADTLNFRLPVPDLQGASVTDISAILTFQGELLAFKNNTGELKTPLLPGWNWTVTTSAGKLTINGKGPSITTPVNLDFQIMLYTYLGDKSRSVVNILPTFTGLSCIESFNDSSVTNISTCFTEGRLITISKNKYSLQEISPNPVNGDIININYTIALEAGTKLDLYNAYGEKVKSIVNDVQQNGTYELTVPINNIANGVYFLHLESGPYTETRQIVIIK